MVAPINYFQQLGFSQPTLAQQTEYFARISNQGQERQMNDLQIQGMQNELSAAAENKLAKQAQFKDAREQAEALRAQQQLYAALNSDDIEGADSVITMHSKKIEELGGAGAVDRARKMLREPGGAEKIKAAALSAIQMAAGPEQFARFTAQQAKPAEQQQAPVSVQEQQYYQRLQQTDPAAAEAYGRKAGFIATGREQAETQNERDWKQYQSLKKQDPESAKQFGQAAGFVSRDGKELSAQGQKRLSEFNDAAVESGRLESKYSMLADEFDKSGIEGGLLGAGGTWRETVKELTGNQDELSELRKEYAKMRGSEVVKNLPPGAASDADVAMALAGFPTDKANAKQISSFLRGVAKLKAFDREYNEFRASFVSETGTERGMLDEWKSKQAAGSRNESDILKEYGL